MGLIRCPNCGNIDIEAQANPNNSSCVIKGLKIFGWTIVILGLIGLIVDRSIIFSILWGFIFVAIAWYLEKRQIKFQQTHYRCALCGTTWESPE